MKKVNQKIFTTSQRKNSFQRKPMRTISGITPLAVMLPPRRCNHGNCVYCPSLNVPQSYTPKSPVVMRAMRVKYDAYKQVKNRLEVFKAMGHPTEKVELIIMGGTFLEYPKKFQYKFVKDCYDGLNGEKSKWNYSGNLSKMLEEVKKKNEKTKNRCVAFCIETRPDVCSKFIDRMRELGVTRVELGVQILDDKIYKKVKRGHTVQDVVEATQNLKDTGFKVGYHIMPGLPGSNLKKDIDLFKKLFSDERFKPDQLKIYPCQVIPGSELENWYWSRKYIPYNKKETEKILIKMLKAVPRYCRVMRVMREIPPEYIIAGTIKIDLRKTIEEELRKNNIKLKEIRYREIGFNPTENFDINLKITKYKASEGDEYFLEIVNSEDILFGLLRLRIKKDLGIIRELHVYGKSLKLGEKIKFQEVQHKGLGKWLMKEAEKICLQKKIKKLKVISGVGVREYYKKIGYYLEDEYMVKRLSENQ